MSVYYFVPVDDEGTYESPEPFEHSSLAGAVAQAQELLAEMAMDGIPARHGEEITIEVRDAQHLPVVRLSLKLLVETA